MHAALHNVAATIVVVGIVGCIVRIIIVVVVIAGANESADEEPAPVVAETVVTETAAGKAVALNCRKAVALNSRGTDRRRAREAVADASALEGASADPRRAKAGAAE